MNEQQIQLAEKIGKLLAQSALDDDIKNSIMEKIEEIPEHLLYKLLDSLELEDEELERTAFEIDLYLKQQDKDWQKVEEDQKKIADDAVDKIASALGK